MTKVVAMIHLIFNYIKRVAIQKIREKMKRKRPMKGNFSESYVGLIHSENNLSPMENDHPESKFMMSDQRFMFSCGEDDVSQNERYFNDENYFVYICGEIYNEDELIAKMNDEWEDSNVGITTLFLKLFEKYGTAFFNFIRGKHTIIIWDKVNETLYGARDHFGIKPLFYYESETTFIVSSNKNSINSLIEKTAIDVGALQHYFSFQYVPEPLTMHKGILMVDPGTCFVKKENEPVQFIKYWKTTFNPVHTTKDYWVDEIRNVLTENVFSRMENTEEIGSLLSGGIDSTIVVSLAKEMRPNLKTFSVGFELDGFSEVELAKETAHHLGVENISVCLTAEQYIEKFPEIIWNLEEPLADPSCVPLYFVMQEASKHVKVVLSGEGSDELFGGYNIYREPSSLRMFHYLPKSIKGLLRLGAEALPEHISGRSFLLRGTTPLKERYIGNAKIFEEEEKQHFLKYYDRNLSYQQITEQYFKEVEEDSFVSQMQHIDINTWMRGDILLKAEKMSKANGIEVRMPFVDKTVYELACKIPDELKIANKTTKYILREASRGIIPEQVLHRKKLGFPVPIRHWLKRELNGWAKEVIRTSEVDEYIDKQFVLSLLQQHCEGKVDVSRKLWTILTFIVWHQVFIEQKYHFQETKKLVLQS